MTITLASEDVQVGMLISQYDFHFSITIITALSEVMAQMPSHLTTLLYFVNRDFKISTFSSEIVASIDELAWAMVTNHADMSFHEAFLDLN
ncbi:hypothetical protein MFIFM68171_09689 [Madurella fahalii]|uniref:Uncharacterized protein n=1 Tax=Madurella fahalii TaxID=1157608 RepID=A0ABQ0GP31_9PEZI